MNNSLPFHFVFLSTLGVIVIALAIYRKLISANEDDMLHLGESDLGISQQQLSLARQLDSIDRWGKLLTAISLVYGIVIACVYLHTAWHETAQASLRL